AGALVPDPAATKDRIENEGPDLKLCFLLAGFEFSRKILRQRVLCDSELGGDVRFRGAVFRQRLHLDALLSGRFECRAGIFLITVKNPANEPCSASRPRSACMNSKNPTSLSSIKYPDKYSAKLRRGNGGVSRAGVGFTSPALLSDPFAWSRNAAVYRL